MKHLRKFPYILAAIATAFCSACTDEVGLSDVWYPWKSPESYSLLISQDALDFEGQGGSKTITITSDFEWRIVNKPDFVTISPMSGGKGLTYVLITANNNAAFSEREGKIEVFLTTLPYGMSLSRTIGISQGFRKIFIVNNVEFEMVFVEGGSFTMGNTTDVHNMSNKKEEPAHHVTLNNYMIGKTEVTQELWQAVMKNNPSKFKGITNPVETVSWDDCQDFISKLNTLTGQSFRLPTEAEWEFAARGGNKSKDYLYSGSNTAGDVAWYADNSNKKTSPVATKEPNELGIYDMSGNVWEWCNDWYDADYYNSSPSTNPKGPTSGTNRVNRGGGWTSGVTGCRSSWRNDWSPSARVDYLGFRIALCPSK